MTTTALTFRAASGTTARDLSDVRDVLPQGWRAITVPEAEGPWIDLRAPNGNLWTIGQQDGKFHATGERPDANWPDLDTDWPDLGTFHTAREAAEAILAA